MAGLSEPQWSASSAQSRALPVWFPGEQQPTQLQSDWVRRRPALAVSTGRNPSRPLLPGAAAPARMLGLPGEAEEERSFVPVLPWWAGSEIKGQ